MTEAKDKKTWSELTAGAIAGLICVGLGSYGLVWALRPVYTPPVDWIHIAVGALSVRAVLPRGWLR